MQVYLNQESNEKKKHKRRLLSKYDAVKVYVWLPGASPHSYVLSRYLIARMLTVAKLPYTKSAKLAMMLKKQLVDEEQLNISQDELENCLFEQMKLKGFGNDYFQRLKLVNRFFCEKIPLIITICGAPYTGKSILAQQLAAKCNFPNVLQTDLVYEMLRKRKDSPLPNQSFLSRPDLGRGRDLLVEYDRECLILKRSLEAEIQKTVQEGKCLIIEGIHLDPGLYLSEFSQLNKSQESRNGPNIVYIPVVVTADNEDHRILVLGASNSIGCRFFEPQSIPSSEEIFDRIRQFQDHLVEYQNKDIVQVEIGLSGIESALETLHDRFLHCIQCSLNSHHAI